MVTQATPPSISAAAWTLAILGALCLGGAQLVKRKLARRPASLFLSIGLNLVGILSLLSALLFWLVIAKGLANPQH